MKQCITIHPVLDNQQKYRIWIFAPKLNLQILMLIFGAKIQIQNEQLRSQYIVKWDIFLDFQTLWFIKETFISLRIIIIEIEFLFSHDDIFYSTFPLALSRRNLTCKILKDFEKCCQLL